MTNSPAANAIGAIESASKFIFNPLVLFAIFAGLDYHFDATPTAAEMVGAGLPALIAGLVFKAGVQGVPLKRALFSF